MLVLTRKISESIRIGEDIVITVTQIQGNRVRLGIDAPKKVKVVRGELLPPSLPEVPKRFDVPGFELPGSGELGYTSNA